ncbi:efflux RND transporter periplasmic adaptor subunit [Terrimonas ferruginea]|uniref:efflux RND transporter periplasmic adaptor subunit n=1 Tax=Terrimonas ferruginea TaxID=249 RepID=UPI0003F562D0|nr:efflux RND transporter periplasmic adaptor subunit [Terrimonas ferruginea]
MKKTWKWILIIAAVLLAVIVGSKIFFPKDNSQKVAVEKVVRRTIVETVTASGQIYPEVEVKISPDISGEVTDLNVQEGDSVKKGQVLARIYADITALQRDEAASRVSQSQATVANSQAALQALDASVTQARQAYDRNKKLYNEKVISQSELEQYETTLRTATANYEAAKENIRSLQAGVRVSQTGLTSANKNLERATIVAPMNGVISSLSIKKGERVVGTAQMAGTEMMTVADMSVLEVRVDVGENDIVKVSIGDSADVSVDAYNRRKFRGIVTQIASSTKSGATGISTSTTDVTNYEVRIRLDKSSYEDLVDPANPKKFPFRPGMNANADIKTKRVANVLAVPIASVNVRTKGTDQSMEDRKKEKEQSKADDNGTTATPATADDDMEEVVFTVQEDGSVKKQVVRSGIQDANYIEILSGLKGGEQIVTAPYTTISEILKDGMKVKVVPKEELFKK